MLVGFLVLLGLLAFDTNGKGEKGGIGALETLDFQEDLCCLAGYIDENFTNSTTVEDYPPGRYEYHTTLLPHRSALVAPDEFPAM